MYENMPKTPIQFLQPPPPPAVSWFQRKIYPNVDGNWENSTTFSHDVMHWSALVWAGMQETVLQKYLLL